MSLDRHVSVSITADTAAPTQAGFGTPLYLAQDVPAGFLDYVREYGDITELSDAGFSATGKTYSAVAVLFAQNPRPEKVKIGRRATKDTETFDLTPTAKGEGYIHKVTIDSTEFSYTELSGDAVSDITLGLTTVINAGSVAVTATDNTTKVTVAVDVAGTSFAFEDWSDSIVLTDVTADPGIATDLAAILSEDADFYGVFADSSAEAVQAAIASWCATNNKLAAFRSADDNFYDAGSSADIASTLKTAANSHAGAWYAGKDTWNFVDAGILGKMLPKTPGTATWAYKTLQNVDAVTITGGKKTAIEDKYGNWYSPVAGLNKTWEGKVGSNEYYDTTRGIDYTKARMQEEVFAAVSATDKLPYAELGVDVIRAAVTAVLQRLTISPTNPQNFLSNDPEPTVTTLPVADQATADKASRILRGVKFSAELAGALHKVVLSGTITV